MIYSNRMAVVLLSYFVARGEETGHEAYIAGSIAASRPRLLIDIHGDQIGDVIRQESSTPLLSVLNRKMVQTQTSVLLQDYQLRTVQPTNPRDQVYGTFDVCYFIAIYASCWLY
jgi:hypothetical protein